MTNRITATMRKRNRTALNDWIGRCATRLIHRLTQYTALDEDAFQDAYIELYEKPEYDRADELEIAFVTIYRNLSRKNFNESYDLCHPDDFFFCSLPTEEEEPMSDREQQKTKRFILAKNIHRYILSAFTPEQNTIWSMRQNGTSLRDTADAFGITEREVKFTMEMMITERTRHQFSHALQPIAL